MIQKTYSFGTRYKDWNTYLNANNFFLKPARDRSPEWQPGFVYRPILKMIAWFLRELGYGPERKTRFECLVCDTKVLDREICYRCKKAILAFRSLADTSEDIAS